MTTARWNEPMLEAIALAHLAVSESGDVPVGAVLLNPAGEVVAVGKNERELSSTAKGVRAANRELNEGAKAWSALTKAVTAYIGLRTLQWMAQLSDQYGQYASRIRNATSSTKSARRDCHNLRNRNRRSHLGTPI